MVDHFGGLHILAIRGVAHLSDINSNSWLHANHGHTILFSTIYYFKEVKRREKRSYNIKAKR